MPSAVAGSALIGWASMPGGRAAVDLPAAAAAGGGGWACARALPGWRDVVRAGKLRRRPCRVRGAQNWVPRREAVNIRAGASDRPVRLQDETNAKEARSAECCWACDAAGPLYDASYSIVDILRHCCDRPFEAGRRRACPLTARAQLRRLVAPEAPPAIALICPDPP